MSIVISRRNFLKSSAIASGAIAAGSLIPRGLTGLAGAAGTSHCRLGGNGSFITAEEAKLGQTLAMHRVYKAWDEVLFSPDVVDSAKKGRRVVMSIFPANHDHTGVKRWADIASGKYDSGLTSIANQLKAFAKTDKRKIGLCFHHEPENDRDDSQGDMHLGNEADFRAAVTHFFSFLTSHGVTNIRRTMILFGSSYRNGKADLYWPGSSYIDRVGADCYNFFGTDDHPDAEWESFQVLAQGLNDYALAKGKLAWVCETATLEDPNDSNRKAQWITDMGATLKSMPTIKAVMWYEGGPHSWSLSVSPEGSAAALSKFKGLLSEDYFI